MTGAMTGQAAAGTSEGRDPFAPFSLDTLVAGAARLRPEAVAFADDGETLTAAEAAARTAALARLLVEYGLRPGERLVLVGGASAALCIALAAGVRAGFDLALAPVDLDAASLAAYARAVGATGLVGASRYGDHDFGETCLAAAMDAPDVRLVASLGPDAMDGAADLSPAAIADFAAARPDDGLARGKPPGAPPAQFLTRRRDGAVVAHRQATLMAAGLDLVTRAKIGRPTPVLTTLPPVTFAGLVAGPVAALLAGSPLRLHGPFTAAGFVDACADLRDPHVVLPAAAGAAIVRSGLTAGFAALIVCTRGEPAPVLPGAACPLVDLYAAAESAAVAEPRADGRSVPPAFEPHHISFDGRRLLAVANEGGHLHGAAVTAAED